MTLSPAFYAAIGVLIVTNIGTLGALIIFIFKVGVFVADTKSGIIDAKERANRAHVRLTKHENENVDVAHRSSQ